MPQSSRFPPEWPSAGPDLAGNAKPPPALGLLRRAIDELYRAAIESELDRTSHGPNIKKNRSTIRHHCNFIATATDAIELLRCARAAVARMPTKANQRSLMRQEQQVIALLERFEDSFNDPPTQQ